MHRSVSSLIFWLLVINQIFFPAALLVANEEKDSCSDQKKRDYDKYLKESYVPKSDQEVKGTKYEAAVQFLDNEPAVFGNIFDLKNPETPPDARQFFLTSKSELDKIEMEICVKEDCTSQSITLCFPSKTTFGEQKSCGCKFDCNKLSNYLQFTQTEQLKMQIDSCDNPVNLESEKGSFAKGKCVKATWSLNEGRSNDDVRSQLSLEGKPVVFGDDIKEGCFYVKFPGLDLKLSGTPPFSGNTENPASNSTVVTFVGSAGFYTWLLLARFAFSSSNSSPSDDPANRPDAATCIAVSEEHSNHPPSEEKDNGRPVEYTARASTEENTFEIGRKKAAQEASRAKTSSKVTAQKKAEDARVKKVNANFNVNETSVDQTTSRVRETKPSIYNPTIGASTDAKSCQQTP
uniref:Uncharacterized protein n=1 Tax=Ditylenchus dipsaci TaxID=166011 RepID=A0A915CLC6_9BILA